MQERSVGDSASASASARALNPSIEGMSWQKVTQDLITQVMEGLKNIPMPSSDNSSATQVKECSLLVQDASILHFLLIRSTLLSILFVPIEIRYTP